MIDTNITTGSPRNVWLRGLFMLLMALAYQVAGTLLFIVAVFQFVMVLLTAAPKETLIYSSSSRKRGSIAFI